MKNEIFTQALYWNKIGEMPSFRYMSIPYDENAVIIKVKAAMFGKALHRAITIGHPKITPPKVLGTLLSGEIVSENRFFPIGTRVIVNPHHMDVKGNRISIDPGAMSQFVKIEGPVEGALYMIPDNVNYDSAVYCELVACALESILKVKDTSNLIIIGCGLMALIQIQIAKCLGVENIICLYNHEERIKLIKKFGALPVEFTENDGLLTKRVFSIINSTEGYAVIDSAGTTISLNTLFRFASDNSKIVLFAGYPIGTTLPVDANDIHYHNCQIIGSYHFEEKRFSEALELMKQGVIDIESLITGKVEWNHFDNVLENFQQSNNISNIVLFD